VDGSPSPLAYRAPRFIEQCFGPPLSIVTSLDFPIIDTSVNSKLFRIMLSVHMGCRISTPINVLFVEAKEAPLEHRFRLLTSKFFVSS